MCISFSIFFLPLFHGYSSGKFEPPIIINLSSSIEAQGPAIPNCSTTPDEGIVPSLVAITFEVAFSCNVIKINIIYTQLISLTALINFYTLYTFTL